MTQLTFQQLEEAANQYDLILFDLWGVIVEGGKVYPGVVEVINRIMNRTNVMFLTNAPRPAFRVADNLRNWGLMEVVEDQVVTSGDVALHMMHEYTTSIGGRVPKIYHLGEDRNKDILSDFKHELTDDLSVADILLLSLYRDDNEDIHEFDSLLKQAAQKPNLFTLCSNPDTKIPNRGSIRYCAGYFAEIIEKSGGKVIYTGKPKAAIYNHALQKQQNISKDRILMVGDTLETDIMGANQAGIHSALVLSGNAAPFHDMRKSMDDKLDALQSRAKSVGVMPSFITSVI